MKSMKLTSVKPTIMKPVSKSAIVRSTTMKFTIKSIIKPTIKPVKPNVSTKRCIQFEGKQNKQVNELNISANSLEDKDNLSLLDHIDLEVIKQYKKKKLQKM